MKLYSIKNLKHFYHKQLLNYIIIENDCFYFARHKGLRETDQFLFMESNTHPHYKFKTVPFLQKTLKLNYGGMY